jgi:hypothetical protein
MKEAVGYRVPQIWPWLRQKDALNVAGNRLGKYCIKLRPHLLEERGDSAILLSLRRIVEHRDIVSMLFEHMAQ